MAKPAGCPLAALLKPRPTINIRPGIKPRPMPKPMPKPMPRPMPNVNINVKPMPKPLRLPKPSVVNLNIKINITIKPGAIFNCSLWGGACACMFVNGIIKFYRTSRGKNAKLQYWMCQSVADTQKFLSGHGVWVTWVGSKGKTGKYFIKVLGVNRFAVYHKNKPYSFFNRMTVSIVRVCFLYCGSSF